MTVTFDADEFEQSVAALIVVALSTSDHAKKAGAEFFAQHAPQYLAEAAANRILALRDRVRQLEKDLALKRRLTEVPDQEERTTKPLSIMRKKITVPARAGSSSEDEPEIGTGPNSA